MMHCNRLLLSFLLTILVTTGWFRATAFNIKCLSVGTAGDVTVSWNQTGLSAAIFQKYYMYHSTAASGPFSLIDSIFIYNNTFDNHPTASANSNPAFYFIVFKPNNGSPDIYSDTLQAIRLLVNNPLTGYAQLTWNATQNPSVSSNFPFYRIYREYPPTFFTLIDSVDSRMVPVPMFYSDLISVCADTVKYRIEVTDSSGCVSVSNVDGDLFRDVVTPVSPAIDSVSVDANGNVILAWDVNTSTDTRDYIINQNVGFWTPIDTVYGIGNTFLNSFLPATSGSRSLEVIAEDSCGNRSPAINAHSTIYLIASFIPCGRSNDLSWTAYSFWPNPVSYVILKSVNGGAEIIAGTSLSTTFSDTSVISGSSYCYRIRALESTTTRTSTSNKVCLSPVFPPPPLFAYIRKVSVLGSDEVYIEAYVDAAASVSGYELLRSDSASGPFSSVQSIIISGVSTISFIDGNVDPSERTYYYKVAAIDSCGLRVFESQISKTILLQATANSDYTNDLSFDDYSSWLGGVDFYYVYRKVNGLLNPVPIAVFPANGTFFLSDNVINETYSDGEFCYVIQAIEGAGNSFFFLDTTYSNEVCVQQQPLIFIPNAFHPGGDFNTSFHPSNGFVNAEGYSLIIFNRWGEEIFKTSDPKAAWDGTTHHKLAAQGVYIYKLNAVDQEGAKIEKVGAVTLIR